MKFSQRLKILIDATGLSKTAFAAKCGISRATVSSIISKGNTPSVDFVGNIIRACENINAAWLVADIGEMWTEEDKNEKSTSKAKPYPTEQPITAKSVEPGAAYVSRVQQLENELEWAKQMIAAKDEMLEMKNDKIKTLEAKLAEGEESIKITDQLNKEAI